RRGGGDDPRHHGYGHPRGVATRSASAPLGRGTRQSMLGPPTRRVRRRAVTVLSREWPLPRSRMRTMTTRSASLTSCPTPRPACRRTERCAVLRRRSCGAGVAAQELRQVLREVLSRREREVLTLRFRLDNTSP